jgi:hypothetical protein
MAVDLADLVEPLKREVSPPGTDTFPNATDDDYIGNLTDAFWELRLFGMLEGFEENAAARGGPPAFTEAIVTPVGVEEGYDQLATPLPGVPDPGYLPGTDLSRDLQQLIVLWAGYKIILTRFATLQSVFRAKAGPVEYEVQQAATVLKSLLDTLKGRIDAIMGQLSTWASGSDVTVLDSVIERSYAQAVHETWWVR